MQTKNLLWDRSPPQKKNGRRSTARYHGNMLFSSAIETYPECLCVSRTDWLSEQVSIDVVVAISTMQRHSEGRSRFGQYCASALFIANHLKGCWLEYRDGTISLSLCGVGSVHVGVCLYVCGVSECVWGDMYLSIYVVCWWVCSDVSY